MKELENEAWKEEFIKNYDICYEDIIDIKFNNGVLVAAMKNEKKLILRPVAKVSFSECKTRYKAQKNHLWACKIVKVEGGHMCFESITDYECWKNQK